MRIAYFDTFSGISGDMTLGAFVAAGVRLDDLREQIARLNLEGVEVEASRVNRHGISAIQVHVIIAGDERRHRHYADITKIIEASTLKDSIKRTANDIVHQVALAESSVHRVPIESIHFHEVGMLDSIVDIVGAAICLDLLNIGRVFTSPVRMGSGTFVNTDHGRLPVPGPAALEILKGYPIVMTDIPAELTTPTGAAIVKALSAGVLSEDIIRVESVGYGAGTRELAEVPNLLRVVVGELAEQFERDECCMIETNIDDMNPEIYPFLIERMLAAGAHDAFLTPVVMKKGRPGIVLSVLGDRSMVGRLTEIILSETTTLGVRVVNVGRRKVERREVVRDTQFGRVKAKGVFKDGKEVVIPEYEECRRISLERGIALKDVYGALEREFVKGKEKA